MIRIRTGEHWKINPDYLRPLKEFTPRRGRSFTAAGVLDVLGIEIDGASFGGHLGEEPIFRLVPDLVDAVGALCRGEGSSRQVSLSEAGLELVIARRGALHATLCLLSLRRPARVVVPEVEVELAALADAVRDCAARLISDLASINRALRYTPLVKSLARKLKHLEKRGRLPTPATPGVARGKKPASPPLSRKTSEVVVGFDLLDDEGRLESAAGKGPDLHSLLVGGRVYLHDDQGSELAAVTGPVFLVLTELSRTASDLLRAAEAGETGYMFSMSPESGAMVLDLKAGVLSVEGRPVRCPPLALARTILEACLAFSGAVRERNPRQASNAYLADLSDRARSELAVVTELESGDLISESTSLPRKQRRATEPPLTGGRLRRLSYRVSWRATVPGPLWGLRLAGSALWCGTGQSSLALDAENGRERWRAHGEMAWAPVDRGEALALAPASRLSLCDLSTGQARWFRSQPAFSILGQKVLRIGSPEGPQGLCAVIDGRRVWACDALTGRTIWEFSPPLAARVWLSGGGPIVLVAADSGFAYALDPSTGSPAWRTRTGKPLDGEPMIGGKMALFTATVGREPWLVALDAGSGRPLFARGLELEECACLLPGPRRIVLIGLEMREAVAVGMGRTGQLLWRTPLPLGRGVPAAIRAAGAIFAAGRDGSVCRLDDTGRVVWARPAAGEELSHAIAPLHRRGVLVAAGSRVQLLDPSTGSVLERLEPMPGVVAMENDKALGLFLADEEGAVIAYRLATHLSLVN